MDLLTGGKHLLIWPEPEPEPVQKSAWITTMPHEDRGTVVLALQNQALHTKKKRGKALRCAASDVATGNVECFNKHRKPVVWALRRAAKAAHGVGHVLLSNKLESAADSTGRQ